MGNDTNIPDKPEPLTKEQQKAILEETARLLKETERLEKEILDTLKDKK